MKKTNKFSFEISLSVLNHLGRNLYRSFATVLGEAISNAWDANAESVYIYIDKENGRFLIKDDGIGMTADDFQNKFLKIGYSKRRDGHSSPHKNRPYIGRKGIGKLALLSCAEKIAVISKKAGGDYIGGVIDNSGLDKAITDDLTPKEYQLGDVKLDAFAQFTKDNDQGTIIHFENIKDGIKHSLAFLKKIVALYFRFSLIDPNFKIYIGDELVTHECLDDLASRTQFLWKINDLRDPYIDRLCKSFELKEIGQFKLEAGIKGFIASVEKPRDLKIITMDERVGVDLFVNGRLRERDILKHIPTARVVESYLYGQIHFNDLDDGMDRFTSSRESIVADDPKYKEFLDFLRDKVIGRILNDWDTWRRKHRNDGDPDNAIISTKERKAEELFNAVTEDFVLPKEATNKKKVDGWVNELAGDAAFNFASYADCFISENLIRKFITEKNITISPEAQRDINEWKRRESQNKVAGGINIDIRHVDVDISYLDMQGLANLVDKTGGQNSLPNDSKQYKPIRDALMHTARLTDEAKRKLTTVYENIKGRIKTLLS
ncbi:MAG: ATP-binding protein [Candidatus Omnitrophota bacterium]